MVVDDIKLNANAYMPIMGLGTWQLTGDLGQLAITKAIEIGYRHIDTADAYHNHQDIAAAIKTSGIDREELFLSTKLWFDDVEPEKVQPAVERFLNELRTNYIDLLLIHWPVERASHAETLSAMQKLVNIGKLRAIGVSNFPLELLKSAKESEEKFKYKIANHQIELHPSLPQDELVDYSKREGISVTAYSPLAQTNDFNLEVVRLLADRHNVSPAQVILAWIMSRGIAVIPRTDDSRHLLENFNSTKLRIDRNDLAKIDKLEMENRIIRPGFALFK
jgi:2,5-diketo-D-gluconate reductase B